jgi:hypothetical protein
MVFINATYAQETWPKELVAPDGTLVRVFQPEPETLKGNILTYRAAISVKEKTMTEPAFGTFWGSATVATDRDNREILFTSVTDIRVPRDSASDRLDYIKAVIQSQLPAAAGPVPIDVIITSLNQQMDQTRLAGSLNTQPPVILVTTSPAELIQTSGTPDLQPVGGSNLAGTNAAREAVMDAQIPQTDQRRPVWNINGKCRNEAPFGLPASSAPDPSPRRILADSVVAATTARPIIS